MTLQQSFDYFKKGFASTNKHLDLAAISVGLSLIAWIGGYVFSFNRLLASLFNLVIVFLIMGFSLSIPLFLAKTSEYKNNSYRLVRQIVVKNTKRIIKPILLIALVALVGLAVISIAISIIFHPTQQAVKSFFDQLTGWSFILGPLVLASIALFLFTPFYFALERLELIPALKRSARFTWNHKTIWILIIVYIFVNIIVNRMISVNLPLGQFLSLILNAYTGLVLTASTYLYYLDKR